LGCQTYTCRFLQDYKQVTGSCVPY
jgi:hypothetical protein